MKQAILMVLVLEADGTECWYPALEYQANPRVGSVVLRNRARYPDPIIDPIVRDVRGKSRVWQMFDEAVRRMREEYSNG